MSPSVTVSRAVAASSTLTVAWALSRVTSPSGPVVVNRALAAVARTADPAGMATARPGAPSTRRGAVTRGPWRRDLRGAAPARGRGPDVASPAGA